MKKRTSQRWREKNQIMFKKLKEKTRRDGKRRKGEKNPI